MKKLLIANRGEIAVRIVRSCKRLGIKTVAIFSPFDNQSILREISDEAVALSGQTAAETYLDIEQILRLAQETSADAIHPGYGFLSESPEFSRAVEGAGLTFVGPSPSSLILAGNKDQARKLAASLGIPVPAGYDETEQSFEHLLRAAEGIGVPLLVKAVAGGGGRGMRLVEKKTELKPSLESAAAEAKKFFGDGRLILEQYLWPVRHIEVQLVGDGNGNVVHLFERDCSMQRRYQKLIEEAPARNFDPALRASIFDAAVKLAKAVGLRGVATAEFLVGDSAYHFLEINPRIQVEHPVTEAITGLDIVELQLRIASGEPLILRQEHIQTRGHAIEARICGELPALNFRPSTGTIELLTLPDTHHLRADHALQKGFSSSGEYDSLLLKLIAWGEDARVATDRLISGLRNTSLGGLDTNIWFLEQLLESEYYGATKVPETSFLDSNLKRFCSPPETEIEAFALRALAGHLAALLVKPGETSRQFDLPTMNFAISSLAFERRWNFPVTNIALSDGLLIFSYAGPKPFICSTHTNNVAGDGGKPSLTVGIRGPDSWFASSVQEVEHFEFQVQRIASWAKKIVQSESTKSVLAPLPGTVLSLAVVEGDKVKAGDLLLRIESMKMEHSVRASAAGKVAQILTTVGARVRANETLIIFA